jgi:hypothetical protein
MSGAEVGYPPSLGDDTKEVHNMTDTHTQGYQNWTNADYKAALQRMGSDPEALSEGLISVASSLNASSNCSPLTLAAAQIAFQKAGVTIPQGLFPTV